MNSSYAVQDLLRFHNVYKYEHPDRVCITMHRDGRYRYEIIRPSQRGP